MTQNSTVVIAWRREQRHEINYMLDCVAWLRQQGMIANRDFTWRVDTVNQVTVFEFVTNPAMASFFKLRFDRAGD